MEHSQILQKRILVASIPTAHVCDCWTVAARVVPRSIVSYWIPHSDAQLFANCTNEEANRLAIGETNEAVSKKIDQAFTKQ